MCDSRVYGPADLFLWLLADEAEECFVMALGQGGAREGGRLNLVCK